jgi:hypothetical protein
MTTMQQRLAKLEAEVAELRKSVFMSQVLGDASLRPGISAGPREHPRPPGRAPASAAASSAPGRRCIMKAAILALVLTTVAPSHVTFAVLGLTALVPVASLILSAEVLAAVVTSWLAVRILRQFRSAPWLRTIRPAGATS